MKTPRCCFRVSESPTQCVIHVGWRATEAHMAQRGDNETEIGSISAKRYRRGGDTVTQQLPEDLPSGRDDSEPRSGKGSDAAEVKCKCSRHPAQTSLCERGQTSCPKTRDTHGHGDIHSTFTTWPPIAAFIKRGQICTGSGKQSGAANGEV